MNDMYLDKFFVLKGLTSNDLADGIVEDMELDQLQLESKKPPSFKILLTWRLELNTFDLTKVLVAIKGHQIIKYIPDSQNNPLDSIKKAIVASHTELQKEIKATARDTFLANYSLRAFDFERAAHKVFDLILGK